MDKILVRFEIDYDRQGSVDGLFVTTKEQMEALSGVNINFGEILGKHSEVWIDDFNWTEFCTVLTDEQDKIEFLIDLLGWNISGYDPSDYYNITESDEYYEGKESNDISECEYDESTELGSYRRWHLGFNDKETK
jgi:hypothetical protein